MTRVLLVEDNPGDAELVRRRLLDARGSDPFELTCAATLDEGCRLCEPMHPEVILLDLNLPDSGGLETVDAFRRCAPAAPIVVLTGTQDIELALEALRRGADDYVPKSELSSDVLRRTVSYAIERRRMMTSLEREREEKAQLFEEAARAAQAQANLFQIVSHDLRNHVNAMQLALKLIRGSGLRDDQMRWFETLERASSTVRRLLDDLVDIAALEQGVLNVDPKPEESARLVEEAYETFLPSVEKKGAVFDRRVDAAAGPVHADRERIVQVLGNLIGNATKFTPPGGQIVVSSEATGEDVVFSVADSGPGIALADRPRIFDRFYRGSRPGGHGAGLGLTIAKALVEAHGGRIWLDGDVGRGATFRFTLRRLNQDAGSGLSDATAIQTTMR